MASPVFASEIRSPWSGGQGPIRYTFDQLHKDAYNVNWWSAAHSKYANKAFTKAGTKTQPLTALIFGKSDFKIGEANANGRMTPGAENFNPLVALKSISPRVEYNERGMTVGGAVDFPIMKNQARVGVRVSVPFRHIEMERLDSGLEKSEDPSNDYVSRRLMVVNRVGATGAAAGGALPAQSRLATAYRLDLFNLLAYANGNAVVSVPAAVAAAPGVPSTGGNINVFGADLGVNRAGVAGLPRALASVAVAATVAGTANIAARNLPGVAYKAATIDAAANAAGIIAALAGVPAGAAALAGGGVDGADVFAAAAQALVAGPAIANPASNTVVNLALVGAAALPADSPLGATANRDAIIAAINAGGAVAAQRALVEPVIRAAADRNFAAIVADDGNGSPLKHGYGITNDAANAGGAGGAGVAGGNYLDRQLIDIPGDFSHLPADATELGVFNVGADYSDVADSQGYKDNADKLWLIFRRAVDSNDPNSLSRGLAGQGSPATGIIDQVELALKQYNKNAFLYLAGANLSLDSTVRTGMGDIDAETFFAYDISKNWRSELAFGVRLPTGGSKKKWGNPYQPILGNGEHFELKLGGLLAYNVVSWMNIKADAAWNFVLKGTEQRMGVFAGSTVKNLGPRADADVSWNYFTGHVDFNFLHPKNSDIRSMVGYELYYKTQDNLKYKLAKITPMEGDRAAKGDNLQPLDSKLAVAGTKSVAHKIRFETSYQISKYFETFVGGSVAFAGENCMLDRDTHGGFNIRF